MRILRLLQELLALSIHVEPQWRDSVECCWPQSASVLLLELPKGIPSFEEAIFNTSLAECKFMDYSINTWQSSHASSMFTMGSSSLTQDTLGAASQTETSPLKLGGGSRHGSQLVSPFDGLRENRHEI